jgi:hypothetical protein
MTEHLPPDLLDLADSPDERAAFAAATRALASSAALPPAFNDRLHAGLNAPVPARRPARFPRLLALAAMLLLGFFLGALYFAPGANPLGASVAWADVVKAVNHVHHFHILAYQEIPNAAGSTPPLSRLDLFYQSRQNAPGLWRAHGLGHVQFVTPGNKPESRIWSLADRAWAPKANVRLIPDGLTNQIETGDLLDVVIASLFHGQPPAAQPVKNDTLTTAGIDVFDYASDPSSQWARIWVLRDSRLPLRMNVYTPQYDGFLLVEFDYADPQPAAFFDPDAFDAGVHALDPETATRPARVFSIGAAPIDNLRPKTATQIHTVQPDARLPKVLSATRTPSGDIALVTTTPANINASGYDEGFEFHTVVDNRGTRYAAGWFTEGARVDENSPRTTFLIPVTAPAPDADTVTVHVFSRSGDARELGTLTAHVAPGPAPKESPSPAARFSVLDTYWHNGTLAERTGFLETALAADPHNIDILRAKLTLLFELNDRAAGWSLYEQEILPRAFDTLLDDMRNPGLFAQYVLHLTNTGRADEADGLLERARTLVQQAANGANRNKKSVAQQALRNDEWNLFGNILALPKLRAWTGSTSKPTVTRIIAAEDHTVIVELALPQNLPPQIIPGIRGTNIANDYGLWSGTTAADLAADGHPLWSRTGQAYDPATHTLSLAFRGSAPTLSLICLITLLRDIYPASAGDLVYRWSLPVAVPAPTVSSGAQWFAANVHNDATKSWYAAPGVPSPFVAADIAAHEALSAGRNAEAAELFANLLRTLDTAGAPPGDSPAELASRRDDYRAGHIRALVALNKLPGAESDVADLVASLPSPPDFHKRADVDRYASAIRTAAVLADALIAADQPAAAHALLDTLEKNRPDLKDVPDTLIREAGPVNSTWFYVNSNRDAWLPLDQSRYALLKSTSK